MGSIRIPQTFGPQQVAAWFGLWRGVHLERDLTITLPVDASVLPAGIALLASALAHRTAQGLTTKFALVGAPTTPEAGQPDAIADLQRVDFFSSLGVPIEDKLQRHEAPDRLVVLRCIDSQALARKMADDARTFLERQLASGEALVHRRQVAGIASAQVRSIDRWEGTWLCLDAPLPG